MEQPKAFITANHALQRVVDQIKDDQWDVAVPKDFQAYHEGPITLRELLNYHAYDDAWVPDTLSGQTMDEAGKNKFKGDLLGADPKAAYDALAEKANAAAEAADDLDRPVHLSYGEYSAREYLWHVTLFRTFRAHDIAKVIGADSTLPDDLVQAVWKYMEPQAETLRGMGVFGPKVDVPEDAPLQDRLLGLSGRQP
jgi:uncharacterized protein (TIGR03086 family)